MKKTAIKWIAVILTSLFASVVAHQAVKAFPKDKNVDFLAIASGIATVAGLGITLRQNAESAKSAQEKRFEALEKELNEKIEKENAEQNQLILDINQRLRNLEYDFSGHQNIWCHAGAAQELFAVKEKISELYASVLMQTREAEIGMRLDKLEQRIKEKNNGRDD